jgi:hypothetical protein
LNYQDRRQSEDLDGLAAGLGLLALLTTVILQTVLSTEVRRKKLGQIAALYAETHWQTPEVIKADRTELTLGTEDRAFCLALEVVTHH